MPNHRPPCLCLVGRASRTLRCASLEAVAELARNVLQRPHAAGPGRLSPLRLLAPVVCKSVVSDIPQEFKDTSEQEGANNALRNGRV